MTGFNHAITGAIIAASIKNPAISLPLAFLSHFALDTLPHYGYQAHTSQPKGIKRKFKLAIIISDPVFYLVFLGVLFHFSASPVVYIGSIVAIIPDFEWAIGYFFFRLRGLKPPTTWVTSFHKSIQRLEYPKWIIVEALWSIVAWVVLIDLLK